MDFTAKNGNDAIDEESLEETSFQRIFFCAMRLTQTES
jgi:hypothetical protein